MAKRRYVVTQASSVQDDKVTAELLDKPIAHEELPQEATEIVITDENSSKDEVAEVVNVKDVEPEAVTSIMDPEFYLDDDDDVRMLQAADAKIDESDAYGIFKQEEGVVSWTITNFIDSSGKQYNKRQLRSNPPVLTLESSTGDKANFVLSKEFSASLATILQRVHYGFFGIEKKPKKQYNLESAKQSVLNSIAARPLQIGAFLVLALVVIVGLIAK